MRTGKTTSWLSMLIVMGFFLSVFTAHAAEITVFAAASLTDCLKRIAFDYEKQTHDKLVFNFAASSTLARQIEEGAPADIFFSADEAEMNKLEKESMIDTKTRESRLSNSLVIIVPSDSDLPIHSTSDLAGASVRRIALADPKAVPAGVYSREYLQKLNLWNVIQAKVVPTENVRGALAAVESGNVEAGMVYKTDAAISKKVKVACEIPREQGPAISYPMAVVKESKHPVEAKSFLEYLDGREASLIFERHGFIVRGKTAEHAH